MRNTLIVLLLLLLTGLFSTSAQEDDMVHIRASHFVLDGEAIDVFLNGDLVFSALSFGQISTWLTLSEDIYDIEIVPTGGSLDDAILSGTYNLHEDDWLNLIVFKKGDDLTIQPLMEDLNSVPNGQARIGVFQAVEGLPPVNGFIGGTQMIRLLSFPGELSADSDGYTNVDLTGGSYTVRFANSNSGINYADLGQVTLDAGSAFFVALIGTPEAVTPVTATTEIATAESSVVSVVDTGEGPLKARIANFGIGTTSVDVYLNNDLIVSGLDYPTVTEYVEFEAGLYQVSIVPEGGDIEAALYTDNLPLYENTLTFIAIVGFGQNDRLSVTTALEENKFPQTGEGRISFFQSIPTNEAFALTLNGSNLMRGAVFPNAFPGAGDGYLSTDIIASRYSFTIESDSITLNVGNITMGADRHYLIASIGSVSSPTFVIIPSDIITSE